MSEDLDSLLNESTGILMAIDELRNKLPEIQKSKIQIEKSIQSFETLTQKQKKELTDTLNKGILELSKYIDKSNNILEQADNKLKETIKIQQDLNKIKNDIDKKIAELGNKNSSLDVTLLEKLKYVIPLTMRELYYVFEPKVPFIVRSTIWSSDCFVVTKVENYKFYGTYYRNGKPNQQKADRKYLDVGGQYDGDEYKFTFYNGNDKEQILKENNK